MGRMLNFQVLHAVKAKTQRIERMAMSGWLLVNACSASIGSTPAKSCRIILTQSLELSWRILVLLAQKACVLKDNNLGVLLWHEIRLMVI